MEYNIDINTAADTSGVDKSKVSLDDLGKKGAEAAREIDQIDGNGIKKIPADVNPARGSISALEAEVNQLNAQLQRIPVGSQEFTVMAGRVKAAQAQLTAARVEATKLAGTVGRGGNSGLAILEFSRAFEDAQYGIRGVLNNLPGLIGMLGGGAGLAGVISLAAVTGSVLWEQLSKGPDDAGKKLTDYLELYKKLRSEFGNASLIDQENARNSYESLLADQARFEEGQGRIRDAENALEKKRSEADGGVRSATARLDLARTEAELVGASGERALTLAKQREVIIEKIVQLEREQLEAQRALQVRAAEQKAQVARDQLTEAQISKGRFSQDAGDTEREITIKTADLVKAQDAKIADIASLTALRDKFNSERNPLNPLDFIAVGLAIERLNAAINNLNTAPSQPEAKATVALDDAKEASKEAKANLKEVADAAKDAAEKFKAASLELDTVKAGQEVDRGKDEGLKTVRDTSAAEQKASQQVNQELANTLAIIGDAAKSPEVQNVVERIKSLAANGVDGGEQQEVFALFQQLLAQSTANADKNREMLNKVIAAIDTSVSTLTAVNAKLDDQNRRLKTLEANVNR